MTLEELRSLHCQPMQGPRDGLAKQDLAQLVRLLPDWRVTQDGKSVQRDFKFKNFHATLGFINAVAYIANREDHHPDIQAGYGHCRLTWSTHSTGGLSRNDFICAARVDALLD